MWKSDKKRYLATGLTYLLVLLAPTAIGILLTRYATNVPFWDQWELVPLLAKFHSGILSFPDIWAQHNEHRIVFPYALMLLLAAISKWNVLYEQVASFAIALATFCLVCSLLKRTFRGAHPVRHSWLYFFSSLMIFSAVQWENFSWGWQIQIFMNVFGVVLAVWSLSSPLKRWTALFLAMGASVFASYSFSNGMLIWGIILLWLLVARSTGKTAFVLAWFVGAMVAGISYFAGYVKPENHPELLYFLHHPYTFFSYFFAYLGSPLGGWSGVRLSALIGCISFIVFVYIICRLWFGDRKSIFQTAIPWLALALYVVTSAAVTGLGRCGFGASQALASRYTTFAIYYWISITVTGALILKDWAKGKSDSPLSRKLGQGLIVISVPVFFLFYISGYVRGVHQFKGHELLLSSAAEYLMSDDDRRADFERILYPDVSLLEKRVRTLCALRTGPFYDPIFTRRENLGIEGSMPLLKQTLGVSFLCRSKSLDGIGLLIGTYERKNTGRIFLLLKDADHGGEVVRKASLEASDISNNTYARFFFKPVRGCLGKRYSFELSYPGSSPLNTVAVYYSNAKAKDQTTFINERIFPGTLLFEELTRGCPGS